MRMVKLFRCQAGHHELPMADPAVGTVLHQSSCHAMPCRCMSCVRLYAMCHPSFLCAFFQQYSPGSAPQEKSMDNADDARSVTTTHRYRILGEVRANHPQAPARRGGGCGEGTPPHSRACLQGYPPAHQGQQQHSVDGAPRQMCGTLFTQTAI